MNILFDMDGVLFDVRESYHGAICGTVESFCGRRPDKAAIHALKRRGGFNSDWKLSAELIRQAGIRVDYRAVVERFQCIFLGRNFSGTISRERPLVERRWLENLSRQHELGIVTGRPREEAEYSLQKWQLANYFRVLITCDDYPPERGKPAPDGLLLALKSLSRQPGIYIGDIPDDVRAAKSAGLTAVVFLPPDSGWERADFVAVQPDFIVNEWKELEEIVC